MPELRFDRGGLASPRTMPDGSVIFSGRAARTGAHEYPWGTERRDASELRRIQPQLAGVPVAHPHPAGLIRDGASANVVGTVISARVDGEFVEIDFRVDQNGKEAIESGASELSLGYSLESGRGEQHRGTVVDHVALVESARCGPACRIRTDGVCDAPCEGAAEPCACANSVPSLTPSKNRATVPESTPVGERMSDTDRNDKAEKILQATITSLEAQRDQEKSRADALQKEVDALKSNRSDTAETDALKAQVADLTKEAETEKARADAAEDPERLRKAVAARVKLVTSALAAIGESDRARFDGKTDREVMVAVIEHSGATVDSEKSEDYVAARFDAIVEAADKARADSDEDPDKQRRADVAARVKLETSGLAVLGEKDRSRFDDKSDREVMVDVLTHLNDKIEIGEDKSDDYVTARFDAAVERFFAGNKALGNLRHAADPTPGERADTASARQKMIESNRNAWKRPTAKA